MDLSWKKDVEQTLRMLEQRTADLPTRLRGGGSGGGGGPSDPIWVRAQSKAQLPDASAVTNTKLGRITEGAFAGAVAIVNPDEDGWNLITHLE